MSRKILLGFLGLMLAWLGAASWAGAQSGQAGGRFQDRFQEVKRSQLGPALGVDQATVDRLLQIEQRYKPMRQQLISQSKAEFQRLQQVMQQPNPSEQEVRNILANVKRNQREIEALKQRQDDEEMAVLSPVQYARYILYNWSLMKEARSVRGGPGGPTGPGKAVPMTPQEPREIPVYRPLPAAPPPQ
jgi:hypothetical protein